MEKSLLSKQLKEKIKTVTGRDTPPLYLYLKEEIEKNCRLFAEIPYANKTVHFATMANCHEEFLKIIKREGIKVFVNSLLHLEAVVNAGFRGEEIVFTASAMDKEIMTKVADEGALINLDSEGQIRLWKKLFPGKPFGIRCNIGENVTPKKTRGGYFIGKNSRLGLTLNELSRLEDKKTVQGLHLYVGTDIMEIEYFINCYKELLEIAKLFPALTYIDVGGGFGIEDTDLTQEFDMKKYGLKVTELMESFSKEYGKSLKLILEPGRILGGKAGYFICRAVDIKFRDGKQWIGVNASSVQFPRPLFYPESAIHPVETIPAEKSGEEHTYLETTIFGCSTYSRDFLARDIKLKAVKEGDLIVFGHAGSYCAASYTHFLGFPKAGELFE